MDEIVRITTYGQTTEMRRADAIRYFTRGVIACEGAEQERYINILDGLRSGLKDVSDQ